ncbi:MAG: MerR family transcriptional regulator [Kofleriaceae bacterium]
MTSTCPTDFEEIYDARDIKQLDTLPAVDQPDEPAQVERDTLLTRAEVAARLGVSTSTVRRYEGELLHPQKGADGVNRFDPQEVAVLAMTLLGQRPAKPKAKGARNADRPRTVGRTPGDVAAEVFERLEQRQSLAEIVIGARVTPEVVRELHREWQRGLIEGELDRDVPLLPAGELLRKRERHVKQTDLEAMFAALELGKNTRISVARSFGIIDYINDGEDVRRLVELGGFIVQGPVSVDELLRRYGPGEYRVSAYALAPPGLLWEVMTSVGLPARARE